MARQEDRMERDVIETHRLEGWQMAGFGRFRLLDDEIVESEGGPGLLWYTQRQFSDFVLTVEWRTFTAQGNSGIFIRFPALGREDPANDWKRAVEHGYEIQIDDRGYNPSTHAEHDPLHWTGAIYGLAPARRVASKPTGQWNVFEIQARGVVISVALNSEAVSELREDCGRPPRGYIGLQNHHPGSRVQFRNLRVALLD